MRSRMKLTPSRIKRLRPKSREYTLWDSDTPHFGIRIRPGGAMRYVHLAQTHGRLAKSTIGDAARMPLDKARAIARNLNDGVVDGLERKSMPTFEEWVEDVWWPQAHAKLKPSTIRIYRECLEQQLLPAFETIRLDRIDRNSILNWFERYSRTSPGGANQALSLLGTIMNFAVRDGVIDYSPVGGIRKNPRPKMTRILDTGERERLLTALDDLPPSERTKALALKMLLFTGCRRNEILFLRWSEVGDGMLQLADSKTGARTVWLGEDAKAILDEARRKQAASKQVSGFVFPSQGNPGECLHISTFGEFWTRLRAGINLGDVRIHDLRHSFASEAVRQGVSLPVVSKLLGHSNIKMTMRYAHTSDKDAEEAIERIGERLVKLLAGGKNPPTLPG